MQQGFIGTLDQLDAYLAEVMEGMQGLMRCKKKTGWAATRVAQNAAESSPAIGA
jgi:hypothetical protein